MRVREGLARGGQGLSGDASLVSGLKRDAEIWTINLCCCAGSAHSGKIQDRKGGVVPWPADGILGMDPAGPQEPKIVSQ